MEKSPQATCHQWDNNVEGYFSQDDRLKQAYRFVCSPFVLGSLIGGIYGLTLVVPSCKVFRFAPPPMGKELLDSSDHEDRKQNLALMCFAEGIFAIFQFPLAFVGGVALGRWIGDDIPAWFPGLSLVFLARVKIIEARLLQKPALELATSMTFLLSALDTITMFQSGATAANFFLDAEIIQSSLDAHADDSQFASWVAKCGLWQSMVIVFAFSAFATVAVHMLPLKLASFLEVLPDVDDQGSPLLPLADTSFKFLGWGSLAYANKAEVILVLGAFPFTMENTNAFLVQFVRIVMMKIPSLYLQQTYAKAKWETSGIENTASAGILALSALMLFKDCMQAVIIQIRSMKHVSSVEAQPHDPWWVHKMVKFREICLIIFRIWCFTFLPAYLLARCAVIACPSMSDELRLQITRNAQAGDSSGSIAV